MNIIKKSNLYSNKIFFEINDNYNNVDLACKSRIDLFNFKSISAYNRILYLDSDILIINDINNVFNLIEDDILYVLEEGTIEYDADWWGKPLFENEINNYEDKTAFSSGIMLFNNCDKIKDLFEKVKLDMITRPIYLSTYDQGYFIYNAFKYNLFNNKKMKKYAASNVMDINTDKTIIHYCGGPGHYIHKIDYMNNFLNLLKDYTITNIINNCKIYINENLLPIIKNINEPLEGNIFMNHLTLDYTNDNDNKIKNISNLVLNKNIKNVMEIGFNSGFSALLMLLSNPNLKINCFDLGDHKYALPCFEKIKETFGDRINITFGNSVKILPKINETYDLIHIDGGHSNFVASNDIINSYRLSKEGTILIMDDYNFPNLHQLWDEYIIYYDLKSLDINIYSTDGHDIKIVVK